MKKLAISLSLILTTTLLFAQQSEAQYALGNDTATVTESLLPSYSYELDSAFADYLYGIMQNSCEVVGDVVYFSDSVYIARLQALPHEMEMPYNQVVKNCIEMYARRQSAVSNMLGIGQAYYFPLFEQTLAKYGVPYELCYLPVIESALRAQAVSRVGAGGLWQFMVATGKLYGLEVNSLVDERCDPIKSTDAAARYLADLYRIYHDWHLVIAAYNCGPGNVSKAINRSGGKTGYWEIYPYLPRETRNYVPIFIAANYIMNYYKEHNICPAKPIITYQTDTVMVKERIHFEQIADVLSIPKEEIAFLNPQYRREVIPGDIKPYPLVLQVDKLNEYILNHDSIVAYKPELVTRMKVVEPAGGSAGAYSGTIYKVKSGDSLGLIAKKHHTTIAAIKKANNLKSDMIHPGQKLRIP